MQKSGCGEKFDFERFRLYSSGMRGERLVLVDTDPMVLQRFPAAVAVFGEKEGHRVIAEVATLDELFKIFERQLKPTVVVMENIFRTDEEASLAVAEIKKRLPRARVISFSHMEQNWADMHWVKHISPKEIAENLTNIQR